MNNGVLQQKKCKSRSEKERRLLKKGGVELLQEYKREESKQRQLQRKKQKKEDDVQCKKQKKEDDVRKQMETAGNAALATSIGELVPLKKKKKRKLQLHKPSSSSAVNQLKQAYKESSVEAKEEKTATVDTTEDGEEEEDIKPAAVQRLEPNEVAQRGPEERDAVLLEDILLTQEERNGRLAIDEVTTLAVNCAVSDATGGNMLQPHGIVPEGEEHQMVGEGTANIGLKWNYKEMGVFLPANPNHPAVHLMKELTFFQKQ